MSIDRLTRAAAWACLLAAASGAAGAEGQPEPAVAAQAAHLLVHPEGLRARLLRDEASPVRRLDPAIFTALLPVTASDPAVRLPPDQRMQDPPGTP